MTIYNKTTIKRIQKEAKGCANSPTEEVEIFPCVDGDIYTWKAILKPPSDNLFHGRKFEVIVKLPSNYPFEPPSIRFLNPPVHQNVYFDGTVCISSTNSDWSPVLTIQQLLFGVLSLINEPNIIDTVLMKGAQFLGASKNKYPSKDSEYKKDQKNNKNK